MANEFITPKQMELEIKQIVEKVCKEKGITTEEFYKGVCSAYNKLLEKYSKGEISGTNSRRA